jgi:DNA adenine methylase
METQMTIAATITEPTRPVLRWHGGKWLLAPWIISHFPPHRVYVEPYGGAGSVLMRKPRSYAEVWNDLDDCVVNLFRILRSDQAHELVRRLRLTPFSRAEFDETSGPFPEDPMEAARHLVMRSFMGFGSNAHGRSTGFRANSNRSGTTPAHDWTNYPDALVAIIERLSGVVIENKDAQKLMVQQDGPDTLFYVDPPYVWATRGDDSPDYVHEMDNDAHEALLAFLKTLAGMVVLSGYPHPMYDQALCNWRRVERKALADGARERTEVLWINPQASRAIDAKNDQHDMFAKHPAIPTAGT